MVTMVTTSQSHQEIIVLTTIKLTRDATIFSRISATSTLLFRGRSGRGAHIYKGFFLGGGVANCGFYPIFHKYPMKMKLFGLTEMLPYFTK